MATYYLDPDQGSDSNTGLSGFDTGGQPFLTLDKALTTATGGDTIKIKTSLTTQVYGVSTAPSVSTSVPVGSETFTTVAVVGGLYQLNLAGSLVHNDVIRISVTGFSNVDYTVPVSPTYPIVIAGIISNFNGAGTSYTASASSNGKQIILSLTANLVKGNWINSSPTVTINSGTVCADVERCESAWTVPGAQAANIVVTASNSNVRRRYQ